MTIASPTRFANLRDVADGLPAGAVRPGALLRSDAPDPSDEVPSHVLWPPRAVLDLRGRSEAGTSHPLAGGATIHHVPVLAAADPTALLDSVDLDGLTSTYLGMLTGTGAAALVRAVEVVATSDGPVLVHCAVGKDRTGVVVALTLRLLGVDRDAVADEYLRTESAVEAILERPAVRNGHYRDRLRAADGTISPLMRPDRVAILAVMDAWDDADGGTAGWYLAHGGTQATLDALEHLRG